MEILPESLMTLVLGVEGEFSKYALIVGSNRELVLALSRP